MARVSYTGRTSADYAFTVDSLDDPEIQELRDLVKSRNRACNRANRAIGYRKYATKGLRIRPRGPRLHRFAKDTPWENATHYDVYIREYK